MPEKLYLCGTLHPDFQGPKRLDKIISHIKPDVIAIEALPEDAEIIIKNRQKWGGMGIDQLMIEFKKEVHLKRMEPINPYSLMQFYKIRGYELWVPLQYVSNHNGKIIYTEEKVLYEKAFTESKFNLNISTMVLFSPCEIQDAIDSAYRFEFGKPPRNKTTIERNRIQAKIIGQTEGTVLSITGLWHVYGESPTLFDLLSNYNPTRINLIEAEKL